MGSFTSGATVFGGEITKPFARDGVDKAILPKIEGVKWDYLPPGVIAESGRGRAAAKA